MSVAASVLERSLLGLHTLDEYEPLIGAAATERIFRKAEGLRTQRVAHVSSTYYGGGVSEILTPLTLMMNASGIETGWSMIQGTPAFFECTKKIHNALQGQKASLSDTEKAIYEKVVAENGLRFPLDECDAVIVHDPQPLPLIARFPDREGSWLWQCHIDLSTPHAAVWDYVQEFIRQYDTAIFSLPEYASSLGIEHCCITPAINPFSPKNAELADEEIEKCLAQYEVPTDLPLVVQISRFDRWKDPLGVIDAVRMAQQQVDCTLVLAGNGATDDPEGVIMRKEVHALAEDRVLVLTADDPILVNALQRRAAVVLQKSIREGFGLTVTEAMWKGATVIGGNVAGIRRQIRDGDNGFLVDSIEQTAERIVQVLTQPEIRARIGVRAKESVRENFLMSHLLEDWLDLLTAFKR